MDDPDQTALGRLDRRVVALEVSTEGLKGQLAAVQLEQASSRAEVRGLIGDLTAKLAAVLSAMEREAGRAEGEAKALARFAWVKILIPYFIMVLLYLGANWVRDVVAAAPAP